MNQSIKEAIEKLDYQSQLRINETIEALNNDKASSIEFYSDDSGVCFTYWSPTVNHGTPGTIARSFRMNEALLILAGHRLKSSEHPICCQLSVLL